MVYDHLKQMHVRVHLSLTIFLMNVITRYISPNVRALHKEKRKIIACLMMIM